MPPMGEARSTEAAVEVPGELSQRVRSDHSRLRITKALDLDFVQCAGGKIAIHTTRSNSMC